MKLNLNPMHPGFRACLEFLSTAGRETWLGQLVDEDTPLTIEEILCHDGWPVGWAIHKRSGARGKRCPYFVVYSHRCPQRVIVKRAYLCDAATSALIIALTNQEVLGGAYKKKGKL